MSKLDKIEQFFKDYKNTGKLIKLNQCESVTDVKQFASVNIKFLRGNSGNKLFKPYADRLNKLYNICVNQQ